METLQYKALSARGKYSGTAMQLKNETVTYEQFDCEADRFCQVLISLGIGPGKAVMLKMHPSFDLVTAMFGIIRSGAAFIPVAFSTPEKRCESIRVSSGAVLTVDETFYEEHRNELPEGTELQMAKEDDPGIILYTSGSTGTPKGVCQSQTAAGFLFDQFPYHLHSTGIDIKEFNTVLARLNYAFVVAYHYEYPSALINGKKLVILTESEQGSILDTSEYLEKNPGTFMAILPSQLALYIENERFCSAMKNLSGVGFFAEPVSDILILKLKENKEFTGSIITVYGSTETFGIGWQDLRQDAGMVPSPEVSIRINGEGGCSLSTGERGEIVIASPTMFQRYLTEEKDKSEKLFAAKNTMADGKRYVRTGDLGYLTPEGSFKLSGRSDRMVKYHGQRVELAEVETVIKNHPAVRNCCAVLLKDLNGNDALVAYYEGEQDKDIDPREMRKYLLQRVPAYMIPACYCRLAHIPLNPNGKIDYRAVAEIRFDFSKKEENEGSHDLTEKEILIADSAAALLKIGPDELVRESNLMALGIDSLNAVILVNELAEKGYELSIDDFVTCETLTELAEHMRERETAGDDDAEVSGLVLCTDMQRFWIDNEFQVVANIVCHRGIEEEELKRKAENCPRLHPALRSSFVEIDGDMYTKVLKEKSISWHYYDIRKLGDGSEDFSAKQASFINMHSYELFHNWDITNYLTVIGIRTHESKTVICIRFDHRVLDGMSEKLLFNEFITANEVSEKDHYISYIRYSGSSEAYAEAGAFWKKYLAGAEPVCMPVNPAPTGKQRIRQFRISLGSERTEQIRENCKRENVSISAYALYQYGRALLDVLGKDDLIMDLGVSGRSAGIPGMDKMIGCLVNAVPVRIRRGDTPKEFMRSYLMADRYGFYPKKRIYKECFGLDSVPRLNPYIVSQIFPQGLVEDEWEYYETPSFEQFQFGEFLWEDADGLHMVWHPDVDFWEENCLEQVEKKLEEYLLTDLY